MDKIDKKINKIVRRVMMARAIKNEHILRNLLDIGINIDKCYLDQDGNLIIPCSEIHKEEPKEDAREFLNRLGTDGKVWAKEFIKINKIRNIAYDEGTMIGWFCNAIEAGRSAK